MVRSSSSSINALYFGKWFLRVVCLGICYKNAPSLQDLGDLIVFNVAENFSDSLTLFFSAAGGISSKKPNLFSSFSRISLIFCCIIASYAAFYCDIFFGAGFSDSF
jgi:hypothetical protein